MELSLRSVTLANRGDLDKIDPGHAAVGWVHAAWYWHQVSLDRPEVEFRLIHLGEAAAAVGMVGYGPAYVDAELTTTIPGRFELAHLVVDHNWHRSGIGRTIARAVLTILAAQPDCREVMVCHHPDNLASRRLFLSLGLAVTNEQNYDGDPVLLAPADAVLSGLS